VLAGGQTWGMTPEHRLLAVQPDKGRRGKRGWLPYLERAQPAWVEAKDLSTGDFLVVRIPRIGRGTRASITIPYVPYAGKQAVRARPAREFPLNEETGELIGFFLAEGSAHPRGLVGFGFHTSETEYHQRVRELMVRYWEVKVGEDVNPRIHSQTIRCNSRQIAEWLIQEFGRHDPERHLPQEVLEEAPEEFLRGVLRGYMNGDGARGKYQISFDTTSPCLAQQIQQIALHFGIYMGMHRRERVGKRRVFSSNAGGENMRALRHLLGWGPPDPAVRGGAPNRTWSRSHRVGDCFYVPVTRVETVEHHGTVYCLNVPGDSSFLLANHVVSHNSDFFKNNAYFLHTNRQMAETAGVTAERIRAYEREHGEKVVEEFLDAVLAIQEHIDPNLRVIRAKPGEARGNPKRRTTQYDDLWLLSGKEETAVAPVRKKIPEEPEKDLLLFLLECAPDLEDWQRDILNIVRNEMMYFLPQMQTKTMNEGWASYFHSRILRDMDLTAEEHIEFSRLHSSVLSPSPRGMSMNPYYVGFKLFEDIERRWNGDLTEREREEYRQEKHGAEWPYKGKGREKMFEVREMENDVSFLRNYLTRHVVDDLDLYIYAKEDDEWVVVEKDWRKVRDALVDSMTNFGFPYLVVEDGDYHRARELYLRHCFDGRELDHHYAVQTLKYVYQLWSRPVHLETIVDEKPVIWSYDGESDSMEEKDAP
jgi:stage V sporulation protein R